MPKRDLEEWVDVVLATGYQDGEVLALRWLDLDLVSPTPTAHVCGTVVEPRGDYVKHIHRQGETKSISGRTLILPQHLVDLFAARAMRGGHTRPEDPVVATAKGNWVSPSTIRARLRRAVAARPDLQGTSPHTLRRTVGTLVAHERGLDAARDQLGHSDPSVTFQHYVARRTVAPDLRDILDAFFGNNSNLRIADPTNQVGATRVVPRSRLEASLADLVNQPAPTAPIARFSTALQRAALRRTPAVKSHPAHTHERAARPPRTIHPSE